MKKIHHDDCLGGTPPRCHCALLTERDALKLQNDRLASALKSSTDNLTRAADAVEALEKCHRNDMEAAIGQRDKAYEEKDAALRLNGELGSLLAELVNALNGCDHEDRYREEIEEAEKLLADKRKCAAVQPSIAGISGECVLVDGHLGDHQNSRAVWNRE